VGFGFKSTSFFLIPTVLGLAVFVDTQLIDSEKILLEDLIMAMIIFAFCLIFFIVGLRISYSTALIISQSLP
jgi:hypothetical protein